MIINDDINYYFLTLLLNYFIIPKLRRPDGRAQRSRGARSDHEKTLPLGGRVKGHVRLYGERGRGGGGQKEERRAPQESRGKSSVGVVVGKHLSLHRCCLPDETTDSRQRREPQELKREIKRRA